MTIPKKVNKKIHHSFEKYSTNLSISSKNSSVLSKKLSKPMLILFNKPYNVLTQFSPQPGVLTLADFIDVKEVYPAGRLDKDSEGLLLLTNNGSLQAQISSPKFKMEKEYWVQVENRPTNEALAKLRMGIQLNDGMTQPAQVDFLCHNGTETPLICEQPIWDRIPPIRKREHIATCWLKIVIKEGRNRQVRRMTAAIGHPTLRLIRYRIGTWTIDHIKNGFWIDAK